MCKGENLLPARGARRSRSAAGGCSPSHQAERFLTQKLAENSDRGYCAVGGLGGGVRGLQLGRRHRSGIGCIRSRCRWGAREDSLRKFEAQELLLPPTLSVSTGRGRHLYFKLPHEITVRNSNGTRLAVGLDVRGEGGLAVIPTSEHKNGTRIFLYTDPPSTDRCAA